jgi:hypothetical protein
MDRQHNGQKKGTNNDLQNIAQKTKDRATQTPQKSGVNSCALKGLAVPAPHVTPVVFLLNDTNIINYGNRVWTP